MLSNQAFSPIKRPGMIITYTQKMADDLNRCTLDPVYFMENFVYIQTGGGVGSYACSGLRIAAAELSLYFCFNIVY